MPSDRSCLSQNPASGCSDVGERWKPLEDTSAGFGGRQHVYGREGQIEHSQHRHDCPVRVSGLLERKMGGAQVGSQMMEGKADTQSDGRFSREALRLAFQGGDFYA